MKNIHSILSRVNAGDYEYFQNMPDEEVKELSPYVLALWLRGANQNREAHTILTDMYLNTKLFTLHKHPRLLYMLAVAANCDMGDTRYTFYKDKKEESGPDIKLVCREYECSPEVGQMYLKLLDKEDLKEIKKKFEEIDK